MSHTVKSQKQKKLSEDGFFSVFSVEFERWEQTVWTAFTVKFKKDGYLWFTNITRFCSRHYLECNFTTCVALVHNRLKTMLIQRYIDKKTVPSITEYHCLKSVQIRSYFCSVFSCIQTECRKISVRIQENANQKWLRIWTLFSQSIQMRMLLISATEIIEEFGFSKCKIKIRRSG